MGAQYFKLPEICKECTFRSTIIDSNNRSDHTCLKFNKVCAKVIDECPYSQTMTEIVKKVDECDEHNKTFVDRFKYLPPSRQKTGY